MNIRLSTGNDKSSGMKNSWDEQLEENVQNITTNCDCVSIKFMIFECLRRFFCKGIIDKRQWLDYNTECCGIARGDYKLVCLICFIYTLLLWDCYRLLMISDANTEIFGVVGYISISFEMIPFESRIIHRYQCNTLSSSILLAGLFAKRSRFFSSLHRIHVVPTTFPNEWNRSHFDD